MRADLFFKEEIARKEHQNRKDEGNGRRICQRHELQAEIHAHPMPAACITVRQKSRHQVAADNVRTMAPTLLAIEHDRGQKQHLKGKARHQERQQRHGLAEDLHQSVRERNEDTESQHEADAEQRIVGFFQHGRSG